MVNLLAAQISVDTPRLCDRPRRLSLCTENLSDEWWVVDGVAVG